MSVAFLINSYGKGGAQRVISLLSAHLGTREQILIYYGGEMAFPFCGEVNALDHNFDLRINFKFGRVVSRILRLTHILRQHKTTTLISFLIRTNILALLIKKVGIFRGRLIINEVTLPFRNRSYTRFQRFLIRLTYPWADVIVVPSLNIGDELVEYYGVDRGKIKLIPNPVDLELVNQMTAQFIPVTLPERRRFRIVSAGRLTALKQFDLLIRAFFELRKRIDAELIIIGDGEEMQSLLSLVEGLGLQEDVFLLGWLSNPFPVFTQCDLFVLTSMYEGFGNVLLEAMACGLPVISFDCPGGPKEILQNSEFGILIESNQVEGLAETIYEMAIDEHKRNHFRQKSQERASQYCAKEIAVSWRRELNLA